MNFIYGASILLSVLAVFRMWGEGADYNLWFWPLIAAIWCANTWAFAHRINKLEREGKLDE